VGRHGGDGGRTRDQPEGLHRRDEIPELPAEAAEFIDVAEHRAHHTVDLVRVDLVSIGAEHRLLLSTNGEVHLARRGQG
jgi:hypothetical protein